ncbi:class C sortase [Corynebacterium lizhenjunii]|uniref:Class C sortase n=1 Tax=Corynebacterium lizhenjunii TaxID=2709394 RepID=A0A7T0KEI3_9CORY|nr:class C sortase [Corynebacterium lizhenjunii]QPK78654.1 class C sortase [Corynebacterium lizhenjunii]
MGGTRPARSKRSVIYLLLALLVFLTPVVLTLAKNYEQHRIAQEYSRTVARLPEQVRAEEFARAAHYNANLPEVGAPDPWINGVDVNSPAYQEYQSILSTLAPMARLRAPAVDLDLPVYHGTSTSVLSHGVGHLYGTALPVGGEGTHAVLTGHTGLATLTMFDNLTHLRAGDVFTVEVMGQVLAYEVTGTETVLPQDIDRIAPVAGQDLLTLVTCTPYGINSHRLLVHGQRVEAPGQLDQRYSSPWQWWMTIAVVLAVLIVLYLLWWSRRRKPAQPTAAITAVGAVLAAGLATASPTPASAQELEVATEGISGQFSAARLEGFAADSAQQLGQAVQANPRLLTSTPGYTLGPERTQSTNSQGVATFSNLEPGVYVVHELSEATAPFLALVRAGELTRATAKATPNSISKTALSTQARPGGEAVFRLSATVPPVDASGRLHQYVLIDELEPRLEFAGVRRAVVRTVDGEKALEPAHYTATVRNGNTVEFSLTAAGLDKLAGLRQGHPETTVSIELLTRVRADSATDTPLRNTAHFAPDGYCLSPEQAGCSAPEASGAVTVTWEQGNLARTGAGVREIVLLAVVLLGLGLVLRRSKEDR